MLPIENSLGGSIHANYDLLLRYDLHIIGEYELRVEHCLLTLPGVELGDVKRCYSHPQALAQCEGYLRSRGIKPEERSDTAQSAQYIQENQLRDCAAIASDLAAEHYGMNICERNIEDDENNFTRFLLLARQPVGALIPAKVPAKTTVVFLCPEAPGALYKALACFALRDVDLSKLESRPTSPTLLRYVQFSSGGGAPASDAETVATAAALGDASDLAAAAGESSRFRYLFHLDFDGSELDEAAQAAIFHLREQSPYVRVLGSYPRGGQLVGPVKASLDQLAIADKGTGALAEAARSAMAQAAAQAAGSDAVGADGAALAPAEKPLRVGIVGFGKFGQFMAKTFAKSASVIAVDANDESRAAEALGVPFYPLYELGEFFREGKPDVLVIAVATLDFESVLKQLPLEALKGVLVVDVLNVKAYPKDLMLEHLPPEADVLCTHPMFGPESGRLGWQGLPMVYERVRVANHERSERFLALFERERCRMIEMQSELHDEYAVNAQFMTHLIGRVLGAQGLEKTPVDTAGYKMALGLVEYTCHDSFDLFFGLFCHNSRSHESLTRVREALSQIERQLAAKEAYLAAKVEMSNSQRRAMIGEVRALMRDAARMDAPSAPARDGPAPDAASAPASVPLSTDLPGGAVLESAIQEDAPGGDGS